jgi:uncharacterized protein (TIGR02757 family)
VFAALLAFGRVDLFGAVLERILGWADTRGGPAGWVDRFDSIDAAQLVPVYYRWHRGEDFITLARLLGRCRARLGSVGALFTPGPLASSLDTAIDTLTGMLDRPPSRSFRSWLARPRDGSACKRWLMLLRWMVRREGVDLGLWTHLDPAELIIPVDTHVLRIARMVGLTSRKTADWRTALDVTTALRTLDPRDPVRFDFALAHLGISEGCRGYFVGEVCGACPLASVCTEATQGPRSPPRRPSSAARPRSRPP